uniref:Prod1 long form n=1 Tax=Aneides lugubris TaxID=57541 RepID=A0A0F6QDT3_9SALA|nr:Prod1 long form [Aneides lugubris]
MKLVLLCLLLAALLPSATALKCFTGYNVAGDDGTATTCQEDETHCLFIRLQYSMIQECKTKQKCMEVLKEAKTIGYRARCCSKDLCNKGLIRKKGYRLGQDSSLQ